MIIKLLYVAIVYKAGVSIGILTPDHIMLFVGIYTLMTGIYMLYYGNFSSLPAMVQRGELDLYIVKPVSPKVSRSTADRAAETCCKSAGSRYGDGAAG